jgi:hypothetical protein
MRIVEARPGSLQRSRHLAIASRRSLALRDRATRSRNACSNVRDSREARLDRVSVILTEP